MLRNLRHLHLRATSEEDCRRNFDDHPIVFTTSITEDFVQLCVHWTHSSNGIVEYRHAVVERWVLQKHSWNEIIRRFRNAVDMALEANMERVRNDLARVSESIKRAKQAERDQAMARVWPSSCSGSGLCMMPSRVSYREASDSGHVF